MAGSINTNRKNAEPPMSRAGREVAPGRPLAGLVNETERRDWEQPGTTSTPAATSFTVKDAAAFAADNVTTIIFPAGTLTLIGPGIVRYTPS